MAWSSSGLGRRPLKAEIGSSNLLQATNDAPPLRRWFFIPNAHFRHAYERPGCPAHAPTQRLFMHARAPWGSSPHHCPHACLEHPPFPHRSHRHAFLFLQNSSHSRFELLFRAYFRESYPQHIMQKPCWNLAGICRETHRAAIPRPAASCAHLPWRTPDSCRTRKGRDDPNGTQSTNSLRHSVLSGMRFVHRGPIRPAAYAEACRPLCGHSEASASRKRHIWSSGPDPFPMEKPLERAPAT